MNRISRTVRSRGQLYLNRKPKFIQDMEIYHSKSGESLLFFGIKIIYTQVWRHLSGNVFVRGFLSRCKWVFGMEMENKGRAVYVDDIRMNVIGFS